MLVSRCRPDFLTAGPREASPHSVAETAASTACRSAFKLVMMHGRYAAAKLVESQTYNAFESNISFFKKKSRTFARSA